MPLNICIYIFRFEKYHKKNSQGTGKIKMKIKMKIKIKIKMKMKMKMKNRYAKKKIGFSLKELSFNPKLNSHRYQTIYFDLL